MKKDRKGLTLLFIFSVFLFLLLILTKFFEKTPESFEGKHIVTKVIDGDTIIVKGRTVRLLGIDADEKGYPCYEEAKKKLEELILGRRVRLERDYEDKDRYGRYLRWLWLNNTNINIWLVENGYVIARTNEKEKYFEEILKAEEYARNNKVGCKWKET